MPSRFCLPWSVLILVSGLALPALQAQTKAGCTPKDMLGDWVSQPLGLFTSGPAAGPFAATGTLSFDGVSRFTGVTTSSFSGHIVFPFPANGSYTLTADCRLTIFEETLRITFEGWFANNKNDAILIETDPTSVSVTSVRRRNTPSCDLKTMQDSWSISANGDNIVTGTKFAFNYLLAFDGKGGVAGIASKSDNGVITQDGVYTGTYSVNSGNCSFNLNVTDTAGVAWGYYGTLFDSAKQLILISNDEGLIVTGYGKRP